MTDEDFFALSATARAALLRKSDRDLAEVKAHAASLVAELRGELLAIYDNAWPGRPGKPKEAWLRDKMAGFEVAPSKPAAPDVTAGVKAFRRALGSV